MFGSVWAAKQNIPPRRCLCSSSAEELLYMHSTGMEKWSSCSAGPKLHLLSLLRILLKMLKDTDMSRKQMLSSATKKTDANSWQQFGKHYHTKKSVKYTHLVSNWCTCSLFLICPRQLWEPNRVIYANYKQPYQIESKLCHFKKIQFEKVDLKTTVTASISIPFKTCIKELCIKNYGLSVFLLSF